MLYHARRPLKGSADDGKRLCELRAARDVVYRVAPQDNSVGRGRSGGGSCPIASERTAGGFMLEAFGAQDGPRLAQDAPRRSKMPPRRPKTRPRRPKMHQESENEADMEPSWHENLAQINIYADNLENQTNIEKLMKKQ